MKLLNFPSFKQTCEYDCGAKVAEAVLDYYGIDIKEHEIIKLAGTNCKGTSIDGILSILRQNGLDCKYGKMGISEVKKFIDLGVPVIMIVQAWTVKKKVDWEKDWSDGHYVIAIGYDDNKLYFEDPYVILRTFLSFDELNERWHFLDGPNGNHHANMGIAVFGPQKAYTPKKAIHMD
jgi:ABC-type bacteriocin/lantibiotic exporter with double-glycine peptidase domain